MKAKRSLLTAAAFALACTATSARAQVYSANAVGPYQFPFPPGTHLVGQTETNGMVWAAAGPVGPQITIAPNSLVVPAPKDSSLLGKSNVRPDYAQTRQIRQNQQTMIP